MNIFSGIFKARDKPANSTAGSRYSFFFGGTSSGKPVNETTAMQMTAVYSCVRILSETVAGLPLNVYKYNDSGGKAKAFKHPLYRLLHDEPNPEMTSFAFRETLMSHLLLWGNAYAQIIRNARGEVGRSGFYTEFTIDSSGRKGKALLKDYLSQITGSSGSKGVTIT